MHRKKQKCFSFNTTRRLVPAVAFALSPKQKKKTFSRKVPKIHWKKYQVDSWTNSWNLEGGLRRSTCAGMHQEPEDGSGGSSRHRKLPTLPGNGPGKHSLVECKAQKTCTRIFFETFCKSIPEQERHQPFPMWIHLH